MYEAYRDDLVVDTGLTIAKLLEFAGALSTVNAADIRGYQIEATAKNIAGAAVLIWDKNSPSMNAILDIFRGVPAANTAPAPVSACHCASIELALIGDCARCCNRVLAIACIMQAMQLFSLHAGRHYCPKCP